MPDQLSWAEIRRLALHHRKALILANLVAVLATLCSVPIPLLLPLLVDEVLLGTGDAALRVMDRFLPASWESAAGYIGLMLGITLLLRASALVFNVLQARLFARLSKDIVYRIRVVDRAPQAHCPWRVREPWRRYGRDPSGHRSGDHRQIHR